MQARKQGSMESKQAREQASKQGIMASKRARTQTQEQTNKQIKRN